MKIPKTITILLLILQGVLTGQDTDKKTTENLLAYVPTDVSQFLIFRPAKILDDKDVMEFRSIAGRSFERVSDRLLNRYLKFGLADLEEIDALIDATWVIKSGRGWNHGSIMILRTANPNEEKFDLATHAVKSESEHLGKTILEMKVPLDGQFRFACILNERTIAWAKTKFSMEQAIAAGKTGAAKTTFYDAWQSVADNRINFFAKVDKYSSRGLPPVIAGLNGIQWFVGGIEPGKTTEVNLTGKFENRKSADAAVRNVGERLESLQTRLKQMALANRQQKVLFDYGQELLESFEFKQTKDRVIARGKVKLEPRKLIEPFNEVFAATKRAEAANNLRQNYLALLNMESAFGKFPSSVLTHESGKQYSWRIAILPFVGRQDIYDAYDFNQDWDSPHNLVVTSEMPDFFRSDTDDANSTNTSFFMLTGPGGAFSASESRKISDFQDGTSNTMTIIEAKREVHWAKPEDIVIDPELPLPDFGGFHDGGFNVSMGDGSVRFVSAEIAEDVLREYFTPQGGEVPQSLDVPIEEEVEDIKD